MANVDYPANDNFNDALVAECNRLVLSGLDAWLERNDSDMLCNAIKDVSIHAPDLVNEAAMYHQKMQFDEDALAATVSFVIILNALAQSNRELSNEESNRLMQYLSLLLDSEANLVQSHFDKTYKVMSLLQQITDSGKLH